MLSLKGNPKKKNSAINMFLYGIKPSIIMLLLLALILLLLWKISSHPSSSFLELIGPVGSPTTEGKV